MHISRIILLLLTLAGLVTTLLPWESVTILGETTATKGTETSIILQSTQMGDAIPCIFCFLLILILALLGKRHFPLSIGKKILNVLLGAFCAGIGMYDIAKMKSLSVSLPDSPLSMTNEAAYGIYCMIAISVLIVLISLIPFKKKMA